MKRKRDLLLCLVLASIFLFASCKAEFVGNKIKTKDKYTLSFSALNKTEKETLELKSGEELSVSVVLESGEVSLFVGKKDGNVLYRGNGLKNARFTLVCTEDGSYSVEVTGRGAKGKLVFERMKKTGTV